jgi:hypothetical protein
VRAILPPGIPLAHEDVTNPLRCELVPEDRGGYASGIRGNSAFYLGSREDGAKVLGEAIPDGAVLRFRSAARAETRHSILSGLTTDGRPSERDRR